MTTNMYVVKQNATASRDVESGQIVERIVQEVLAASVRLLTEGSWQRKLWGFCRCCWWSGNEVQPRCRPTYATRTEMECKSDEQLERLQDITTMMVMTS